MVDGCSSICYGIIVNNEIGEELFQTFLCNSLDNYLQCINTWVPAYWLIGIEDTLKKPQDDIIKIKDLNKFAIPTKADLEAFKLIEKLLFKYQIKWEPERYIIHFTY